MTRNATKCSDMTGYGPHGHPYCGMDHSESAMRERLNPRACMTRHEGAEWQRGRIVYWDENLNCR